MRGNYITYPMRIGDIFITLIYVKKVKVIEMIETIIQNFIAFMKQEQMTQEYAAKLLSITQEHLSRIVNGKRTPSIALLMRMEKMMEEK